ncbi:MAG: metal ABC transporter substrate-binding protein [Xanthobacteraceae bacterium]
MELGTLFGSILLRRLTAGFRRLQRPLSGKLPQRVGGAEHDPSRRSVWRSKENRRDQGDDQVRPIMSAIAALMVCAVSAATVQAAERVPVVASFSIIGDLVKQVGGERVDVDLLVGPDVDMHSFQPSPADSRKLVDAKLVVTNGLGLEGWADRLIKASGYDGDRLIASKGVNALAAHDHGKEPGDDEDHGKGSDHHHGANDPHAWQDVGNARIYVSNIRDALIDIDPENASAYRENAKRYLGELDALDRDIRAAVARIPADKRRVITTHDAFNYFENAYGIEFLAAQGVSGDTEPSARDIARLIRQIRKEKVAALFPENISDGRLLDRIAKETRAKIGGSLYSDALSPADGPSATYVDMMRHNIRTITDALAGQGGRPQ